MSDYTIEATFSELRLKAEEIERNAELVRKEVENITQEINRLRPTFIGKASNKFMREFENARSDMEQWDKIVREFATLLYTAANNLEKADNR